ncbi:glycosyl hydrolase family 65 central catalytic domain protein [Paenibacillus sp. oral taxon 786 str. D14]|uniref:glycosyl hydrolase family 65 protein n=1 Tax=Paenibacillus sp. oral taxon 786 TaxID=652715 RepID=UPI0001AFD560|nr:glycosyl hydrolase family 65 protein [Paenibacillus sp. oral taxon 786]EES71146.1 glycosyl hydrolase family 65 central catalytic domain protein [Paenibacillus sp. oral taxon 786 str. D14]
MSWIVRENGFDPERIAHHGNKFMIGNGVLGYRGTLEEFSKSELTATIVAGLYDQVGSKWREPVNAPNGLETNVFWNGTRLSVLEAGNVATGDSAVKSESAGGERDRSRPELVAHEQSLNLRQAVHRRRSVFRTGDGAEVTITSERFCSAARTELIVCRFTVESSQDGELTIVTGINGDVWDINGPHLVRMESGAHAAGDDATWEVVSLTASTQELGLPITVAEAAEVASGGEHEVLHEDLSIRRRIHVRCRAGEPVVLVKAVAVVAGLEGETANQVQAAAIQSAREARQLGYDRLLSEHAEYWERKWSASDIIVVGDDEAQLALRYSMYQLHIIAPERSEKVSIPARGLSGQVYKGAVFWDTEMFMLPFFLYTQPEVARNLMMYRVHTLGGAKRKAAEYGYEGAFYAWESQETGEDACTLFNVNDVFTGRPMRTYFRDKQVHISADVAYGIWQVYAFTGDDRLLLDGGAEVAWECAKFFYSYGYFNPRKQRYEILDVTGPDEYHERVNNNAFTNRMVKECLRIALDAMEILKRGNSERYEQLLAGSHIQPEHIRDMYERLYVPEPDAQSGLIEQFDRYYALEDVALPQLKSRMLHPHEYLGGGNGLATTTQILKQADVVLMLHLFKDDYDPAIKKANWAYYEPRTEHGSSLSACIYALVAADTGSPDWGYPYFMRTATIDLTGDAKQYVGDLYIGGTHPAANGGAWMAAVLGFAGLRYDGDKAVLRPALPSAWQAIEFPVRLGGGSYRIRVSREEVVITAHGDNPAGLRFTVGEGELAVAPGQEVRIPV